MRVLLCGTHYGATYLQALQNDANGFQLAGILARSERSQDLARHYGVPFFRSADEVHGIDAACVAISGAAGFAITETLLGKGIHVLEEHPQGSAAIATHRSTARASRAVYHINAHYSDFEAAAAFITAYRAMHSPVLFANVVTNLRAVWSAIEILSRAAGPLYGISLTVVPPAPRGFFTIARSGPLTIQVQNVTSAVDDGSANWISHNITAGFEAGVLTLGEAHGPVTWAAAPPSVAQLNSPAAWDQPQWTLLAAPPPTLRDHVFAGRERANRIALARFAGEIRSGVTPPEQHDAHLLGVGQVWESISQHTNLGA